MMARAHTDLAAVEGRLMVLKGVEAGDPDLNGRENPRPARKQRLGRRLGRRLGGG